MSVQLVWFKRDLRISDHAALSAAMAAGPTLALYVIEPSMLGGSDHAPMHTQFVLTSLHELRTALQELNVHLLVVVDEVVSALESLSQYVQIAGIFSHEETGNLLSYARDRAVRKWARSCSIPWREFWQNGVQRPHPKREGWALTWEHRMSQPLVQVPAPQTPIPQPKHLSTLPSLPSLLELAQHFQPSSPSHDVQELVAGERAAKATLESFVTERGRTFRTAVSSPNEAWTSGSRLSAHLAYGNISLREVVQRTRARLQEVQALQDETFANSLTSFLSRLAWHCHFTQKLEDEPSLEVDHGHPGMRDLRNEGKLSFEEDRRLRAWKMGKTGHPMVDACMRCLLHTGWINFRMRAMLVSYASFDLWLHWRPLALHLAQNFVDYEPGIHYPQVQMQAGTMGINTLRMYDPAKQLRDWDPEGTFVKQWLPELRSLPSSMLAEPFKMTRDDQRRFGVMIGTDYPAPMVPHAQAVRHAKAKFEARRLTPSFRDEAQGVFERHGSRRRLRGGG